MGKITKKLIKHFISIITVVVLICFFVSSIFLSKFYMDMQYRELRYSAEKIYDILKSKEDTLGPSLMTQNFSAFLIKENSITTLSHSRMGMMPLFSNIDLKNLKEKGSFKSPMNTEFLYYKYHSDLGDIIIIQNREFSSSYLNIAYFILMLVFLFALVLSVPIIAAFGKRFTKPILELQRASYDISQGNFNINIDINTKDEIEDLSKSLLAMSESLGKRNVLQRNFIANVSHDFKTPLSIIRNYSEAIYDDILDEPERKEYSKSIISEVDRLNSLVMDLLELSKLQGGVYPINKEYFNLKEFLTSFHNTFKSIAASKNIELTFSSPNVQINADPKHIYRVLYNFIDNALKFSFNDSKVEISAILLDGNLKISVKDHGTGIDASMLDDIWNRYYKHSRKGGMGLGLAICSELLKLHGFVYGVKSQPNEETEFYFFIPKDSIIFK
ncbi:HAMP domain-containing sensor histidine kinase [Clostridium sp. A1-XYC3]|uniref:histidine kinase n=1 Tax=Clostridium tanneri TaxID=3037988 RepID=A0ABU4JXK1_9CLOT|nr:HAMP domain-containing sensor histidine kinase [Clostridium sp. A1-XYC3]MDW8802888.1 HAMP domain-containing sensor histidine kinase [Clostridium sp. A1-XYC3]